MRLPGKHTHRREDNIKMDLEVACEDADWIHLTQDRIQWRDPVNTVMNLRFP